MLWRPRPTSRRYQYNRTPQQQAGAATAERQANPPVASFRLGRIRVSIWKNHSATQGIWYSFTLARTYKDPKTGQYKSASSFGMDDLLAVGEVCRQARWWAEDQHQRERERQAQAAQTAADQAEGKGDAYEPPEDNGASAEGESTDVPF
jgi:hypothetical protein